VVTKVIGTSFKINSKSAKKNVEVEVLSGKVSVYNKDIQKQKKKTNNGVVLTPNQKVTYHAENKQFVTAVVDEPVLIETDRKDTAPQAKLDFIYDETPIELVLAQLEENYGLKIEVVENERFSNCPLTANLSKQSLYNKLEMICTSLKKISQYYW